MKKFIFTLVLCSISLSIFHSCVPTKPVDEERILPPERLIKKLEGNRRKIKSFKGNGVLIVESPEFSANTNFEVQLKKPDSIKISIYGPFGIDLAHGLVTKNDFIFYDVLKNNAYTGESDNKILEKLFRVNLTFDDIIDAFAGAINLTDKLQREPDNYKVTGEYYTLRYIDTVRNTRSMYKIQVDNLALEEYKLSNSKGENLFEGWYSGFKMFDDIPVPYKTIVKNNLFSQTLNIEYRNVSINPRLNKLQIKLPNDVNVVKW